MGAKLKTLCRDNRRNIRIIMVGLWLISVARVVVVKLFLVLVLFVLHKMVFLLLLFLVGPSFLQKTGFARQKFCIILTPADVVDVLSCL